MFVGEAPGRLGADASEIPFHGDQAGHNFEELLAFAGLNRSTIFVTNAVQCNPKAHNGNNSTPTTSEVRNCSEYLQQQVDLIQPRMVVALGAVALDALGLISAHHLKLATHVRTIRSWYGRKLIPLYHPGARALVHRSMANQRSDYQFVAEQLQKLTKAPRKVQGVTTESVAALAREIIRAKGSVSYFGLHKLMFLAECEAWNRLGHQVTSAFFLRQKDGPYCTDLHLSKLRKALPELLVSGDSRSPVLRLPQARIFDAPADLLPVETRQIVASVLESAGELSDSELKTRVYLSTPMRRMLRAERTQLVNLYNSPIEFGPKMRGAANEV